MNFKLTKKEKLAGLLLLLPSMLGLMVFYLIPYVIMLGYSLLGEGSILKRFGSVLSNSVFDLASKNTLIFTGISVPLLIFLSMVLAIQLNKKIFLRDKMQAAFILPLVLPVASIIIFFEMIFDLNGLLNMILNFFNIDGVNWINSQYAMLVIIVIYIWKNIGYNVILFLAGLQSIPKSYYEAAELDGANSVKKFIHITFIYLMPTTFFVLIISIINSFKVFKEIYILTGPYPNNSIYMLQHYMNNLFHKLEYSKLVTASIIMSFVILIVVMILFKIQKKIMDVIN